jgi:dTDP-D-glucose 4,6-dehydratase
LEVGALDTTRDFIDVRDVAAALLLVAHRGDHGGTYNIASGRETPIHFILSELLRISGLTVAIQPRNDLPRGVRRHVADVSRLRRLGFVPAHTLGESLRDLFRYEQAELCMCTQSSPNCLQKPGRTCGHSRTAVRRSTKSLRARHAITRYAALMSGNAGDDSY